MTNNWKKINYLTKYFMTAQITTAQVARTFQIYNCNCDQLHTKINPAYKCMEHLSTERNFASLASFKSIFRDVDFLAARRIVMNFYTVSQKKHSRRF